MELQPVKGKKNVSKVGKANLLLEDLLVANTGVDVVLIDQTQNGLEPADDEILIVSFCEV